MRISRITVLAVAEPRTPGQGRDEFFLISARPCDCSRPGPSSCDAQGVTRCIYPLAAAPQPKRNLLSYKLVYATFADCNAIEGQSYV